MYYISLDRDIIIRNRKKDIKNYISYKMKYTPRTRRLNAKKFKRNNKNLFEELKDTLPSQPVKLYGNNKVTYIRLIYIIGIIVWLALIL